MPKCYQLVGVPGAGKTTWVNNQNWIQNCEIVSTDRWIDVFARELGKTYSEIFSDFMPAAVRAMSAQVAMAQVLNKDIIWDQTSTTAGSRRKKFVSLPNYEHIAVVFTTPDLEELNRRLGARPGKNIPQDVMDQMINNFEMPTEEEGFVEIWHAQ